MAFYISLLNRKSLFCNTSKNLPYSPDVYLQHVKLHHSIVQPLPLSVKVLFTNYPGIEQGSLDEFVVRLGLGERFMCCAILFAAMALPF